MLYVFCRNIKMYCGMTVIWRLLYIEGTVKHGLPKEVTFQLRRNKCKKSGQPCQDIYPYIRYQIFATIFILSDNFQELLL